MCDKKIEDGKIEDSRSGGLADDHPLWCVNEQITDLLSGWGAGEDHENVIRFLRSTGLPDDTVKRMHRALVCGEKKSPESRIQKPEIGVNPFRILDVVRFEDGGENDYVVYGMARDRRGWMYDILQLCGDGRQFRDVRAEDLVMVCVGDNSAKVPGSVKRPVHGGYPGMKVADEVPVWKWVRSMVDESESPFCVSPICCDVQKDGLYCSDGSRVKLAEFAGAVGEGDMEAAQEERAKVGYEAWKLYLLGHSNILPVEWEELGDDRREAFVRFANEISRPDPATLKSKPFPGMFILDELDNFAADAFKKEVAEAAEPDPRYLTIDLADLRLAECHERVRVTRSALDIDTGIEHPREVDVLETCRLIQSDGSCITLKGGIAEKVGIYLREKGVQS